MRSYSVFTVLFLIPFLMFVNGCATTQPEIQAPPSDAGILPPKVTVLEKISFVEEENYTRIRMDGSDRMPAPFYRLLPDPNRIVIDIPNVDLTQIREPLKIHNQTISEVVATQYDDKGRIEIGLLERTQYNISKEDRVLLVDVERVKRVVEHKEVEKKKETEEIKESKPLTEERVEVAKEEKLEPAPTTPAKEEVQPRPDASPVAPVSQKAKEIIDFAVVENNGSLTFSVVADGRLENYNSFKMDSPARLVLDIWGVNTRYPKRLIRTQNPHIKEVRIGHHPDKLRLVFDAAKPSLPPYQINRMEDRLVLFVGDNPPRAETQIALNAAKAAPTIEKKEAPKASQKTEGKAIPSTGKAAQPTKGNVVTGIDFKQMDHKSRVIITTVEEPEFESQVISKNVIALDIKKANAPKHLLRSLDTTAFESAVSHVDIKNIKGRPANDVRILITLKEEVAYQVTQEGRSLYIDLDEPKRIGKAGETAPVTSGEKAIPEVKKEEGRPTPEPKRAEPELPKAEEKPAALPPVAIKGEEVKKATEDISSAKTYTGQKLSLDFKDADIKNILRLIAEVSNLNIIAGEDVSGKITMRLVDVPWDQALDVILQARSLGMTRVGNVMRVAPVDKLKKEVEEELSAKRAKEKLEDLMTDLIPVNYALAKEIVPQIKSVLSERGDVKVDERTNILIVKDIAKNIVEAKNLVKALDTKTPQVLIEARIVEANINFQRELGVIWGFQAGGGRATVGGGLPSTTLGTPTREVVGLPAIARSGVAGTSGTAGVIEFLFSRGTIQQLDVAISAHENKGDTKIISSPKIATLDNKEASIEQGLRIPYLKLTTEGTVTTDFIDANIKLTVIPHVTSDGHVKLNIKVKKDAPDQTIVVQGVPSIDKKEAITEVLVRDDGVVAIAGIYTIDKSEGAEGIPLFSKIPILGWLFKREAKQDNRRDLLIFISPKILKDQV